MNKAKFLFLTFFLLFCVKFFAQNPYFINLSKETSIPDTEIYSILEAKDKSFWIAANRGLYNFDGLNYKHYTNWLKKGLSVFGLSYDSKNRLWCNNISGQFFYVENNKLKLFIDLNKELKGTLSEFYFFSNKLWVFSSNAVFVVDSKKNIKKIFESDERLGSPFLYNDSIFFSSGKKAYKISNNKIQFIETIPLKHFDNFVTTKWFLVNNKLYLLAYDSKNLTNFFYKLNQNKFVEINEFKELKKLRIVSVNEIDKELFFSTSKGVFSYELNVSNSFTPKRELFKNNFITKTCKDAYGSYWFSGVNDGLFIIPNINFKYAKLFETDNSITCIEKLDNNKVLIGTFNGKLYVFNIASQKITEINRPQQNNKITAIKYVSSKKIAFISAENIFYTYDLTKNLISTSGLNLINAKSIEYSEKKDALLYSSFDRASILYFKNKTSIVDREKLEPKRSYSIVEGNLNEEIVVSFSDETKYYPKSGNPFQIKYKNAIILSSCVTSSNDGTIWLSTYNDGVLGFKNGKLIDEINVNNQLSSTLISKIIANENLWIVNAKGIQYYDIKSKKINTYFDNSKDFNEHFIDLIENENEVLIATNSSLLLLPKESSYKNIVPNEIHIKDIIVNNKSKQIGELNSLKSFENQILIEAYCNGYFPKSALSYEYKLDGLNSKWIKFNDNKIVFNGLSPNNYTLTIRVKNNFSNSYVYSKPMNFTILNPFWKTGWFIGAFTFIILTVSLLFYKNQLKIKEKENTLALNQANYEKEVVNLQLENLKSQMNPHFIFNALNSIQEYILLNEKKLASDYLAKFAHLIRTYLNQSSLGYVSVEEEVTCLNTYLELEKLRFEDKLEYKINLNFVNSDLLIPTMLIQPYVENALKHGLLHKKDNRKLEINFFHDKKENEISCIIIDNGVGREKATQLNKKQHKSFATNANQNRLELLNKERQKNIGVNIEDLFKDALPAGTKVTLKIPII